MHMKTESAPTQSRARSTAAWTIPAFRVTLAVLTLLVLLQAAFAGQFLSGNAGGLDMHRATAEVILVVAILQGLLSIVIWRPGHGPGWLPIAGVALFLAIGNQIGAGYEHRLALHVPLGVAILGFTVWLLVATGRLRRS
jgi:hypothetical protein